MMVIPQPTNERWESKVNVYTVRRFLGWCRQTWVMSSDGYSWTLPPTCPFHGSVNHTDQIKDEPATVKGLWKLATERLSDWIELGVKRRTEMLWECLDKLTLYFSLKGDNHCKTTCNFCLSGVSPTFISVNSHHQRKCVGQFVLQWRLHLKQALIVLRHSPKVQIFCWL